jgi:Tfp pilus assembly protein PilN
MPICNCAWLGDEEIKLKPIHINLLPIERRARRNDLSWLFSRRFIWPTLVAICLGVTFSVQWVVKKAEVEELKNSLSLLQLEIDKNQPILNKIQELKTNLARTEKKIKALNSIRESKKRWITIFENVNTVLPPNMWFQSLTQEGTGDVIKITGSTYQFSEVAQYLLDLETQIAVKKANLVRINSVKKGATSVFEFEIRVDLNEDFNEDVDSMNKTVNADTLGAK